jgi:hypothetical protein
MPSESFKFHVKASIVGWLVNNTPKTLQCWREADIQVAKLDRMAAEFDKKFPLSSTLTVPAKRLRRDKGPALKRLAEQGRRVDDAVAKLMEEQNEPLITSKSATRKKLRMSLQMYVDSLNRAVHEVTKQRLLSEKK